MPRPRLRPPSYGKSDLRRGPGGQELCFALIGAQRNFNASLWIRDGSYSVRTIQSGGEATIFLQHFPHEGRGAVYHATFAFVQKAGEGRLICVQAREAFWRFADDAGILAKTGAA